MNKSAFLKLIQQVSDITDQQQSELEQVAATFPYCQTAHLLLAKSAYDRGSMLSTQRLRRASSYATDRQLLKRIIYSAPVLEPAYATEDDEPIEEAPIPEESATTETFETLAHSDDNVTEGKAEEEIHPEASFTAESEQLDEVYSPVVAPEAPYPADEEAAIEEENPEASVDSELALLFTFNSISSSSTDLLSNRADDASDLEEQDWEASHLAETAETLGALQQEDTIPEAAEEADEQPIPADNLEELDTSSEQEAFAPSTLQEVVEPATFQEKEEAIASEHHEEEAVINYSLDEIDRLYAEDALGYWMGSSRMGEVLQLKDDYTRQRPISFHPELILEYSKTHEFEHATQPAADVLSVQLDIIDQFLKVNPRLKSMATLKLKPEPQEDLSLKSSKIKKGMASESLAGIFMKQGKTKKALKIYEQLILKYPEKKSYFAEQIEKLQNIT